MVLKQEGVREISKGIKKFQGFRDENCGILQSTSSGGRELKVFFDPVLFFLSGSTSSGGRELKWITLCFYIQIIRRHVPRGTCE